jgi:hypothetical protein
MHSITYWKYAVANMTTLRILIVILDNFNADSILCITIKKLHFLFIRLVNSRVANYKVSGSKRRRNAKIYKYRKREPNAVFIIQRRTRSITFNGQAYVMKRIVKIHLL